MKSPLSQQFGSCIRSLRLQAKLSQIEFGEKCAFYQTNLSRIENGNATPFFNAMEVIANALGLTVFDLFEKVKNTHSRE